MKSKKLFIASLILLLFAALFLRLFLLRGDNLFFTVDQGRDAVYVREILSRGRIFTKGPETGIRGIFAGPLFYYFISPGYFLTSGHPFGGVLPIILLNIFLIISLVLWLRKGIGDIKALLVGTALQFYWPFFETSLWSFNPFPLVALSFLLLYCLIKFFESRANYYYLSFVVVFLAFNAEVAGAIVFFITTLLAGLWGVKKRIISSKKFLIATVFIPLFVVLILARTFFFQFIRVNIMGYKAVEESGGSASQVFSGTNFVALFGEFVNIIGSAVIPQNVLLGVLVIICLLAFYYRFNRKLNKEHQKFILLTILMTLLSFIFFASTKGWRSWQTVYLPPLVFVSTLLLIINLSKKLSLLLFSVVLVFQVINFKAKYIDYLRPNDNPSLLYNELKAIDWVYRESENQGFRVYNYTDTFYDYPYQYLFWWHGLSKYGYLPDEYANFPLSHKDLYIPGSENYLQPARSGVGLKYLIIQSETNGEDNKDWPDKFRLYHDLTGTTAVGGIKIEKYKPKNNAPSDLCIWWRECNSLEKDKLP